MSEEIVEEKSEEDPRIGELRMEYATRAAALGAMLSCNWNQSFSQDKKLSDFGWSEFHDTSLELMDMLHRFMETFDDEYELCENCYDVFMGLQEEHNEEEFGEVEFPTPKGTMQ